MHNLSKLGFILGGLLSCQAFAATLSVPDFYQVMYVDRQDPTFIDDNNVELSAGQHEVVVRYDHTIERFKEEEEFKSEPIIIDVDISPDAQIKLVAQPPKKYSQMEGYAENPQFTLVNQQGARIDYQSQVLPLKPGLQIGRNYINEIIALKGLKDSQTRVAVLESQLAQSKQSQPATSASSGFAALQKLYRQADPASKIAYRIWIIDPSTLAKQPNEQLQQLKQGYVMLSSKEKKAMQMWMIE